MKKPKARKLVQKKQKKAFIVFGATGGIGRVIAKALYDAGYFVTLFARTEEKLAKLVSEYADKERVHLVMGDVLAISDVENAFDRTMGVFGTIDGAINATGSWKMLDLDAPIQEAVDVTETMFRTHVLPVQIIGRIAKEFFLGEKKRGLVLNISSHAGYRPELPGNLAYGPAKAAARLLMESFDVQLRKKHGIRFCDIAPAIVNTPEAAELLDTPLKRKLAVQPSAIAKYIVKNIADPRIARTKNFTSIIEV